MIKQGKLKRPFLKNNLMISDIYTEKTITDGKIDQLIYITVADKTTGNSESYSIIPSVSEIKQAINNRG
jgi:hypothetical protein